MLGNFEDFRLSDQPAVEIIEQSENAIQFRWPASTWQQIFNGQELFGVSLQELVDCFGAVAQKLAAYMGCTHQQELQDGWLVFTVKKK